MNDPHHHIRGLLLSVGAGAVGAIILIITYFLIFCNMIGTTFLLLSVPLSVELVSDYNRIVKKKKVDNHAPDVIVRAVLLLAFSFLDAWLNQGGITLLNVLQAFLLGVAWFWLLFDYVLNWFIKRPILSLGETSWLDKKLSGWPWWMVLLAKVWFFGLGIGVYYYWHLIV